MTENNNQTPTPTEHPKKVIQHLVDAAITTFIHRIWDIEDCANKFVILARQERLRNSVEIKTELEECLDLLNSKPIPGIDAEKRLRDAIRQLERHHRARHVEVLERSLFISIFSSFDKFIGELIIGLYSLNSSLYKNINREVPLSEALTYNSMSELREAVLQKEIETLKRKSYAEQFSELEKKFGITLTKFGSWSNFIEMSQRRNLFTHCDGVISQQYIDSCENAGFKFASPAKIGEQLHVGSAYLLEACHVISEVAIMLGHTLWRKIAINDIQVADTRLNSLIYEFLQKEDWDRSISLCKFSQQLPKISDEEIGRMLLINYAIALKAKGEKASALKILDLKDWNVVDYRFQLAYAVISDKFDDAGKLMRRIGKDPLISEMSYLDWPLFRDFRETPEFCENYEAVYGYKYSLKLSSIAEEKGIEVIADGVIETLNVEDTSSDSSKIDDDNIDDGAHH